MTLNFTQPNQKLDIFKGTQEPKKPLSKLDQSQATAHLYSNFSLESASTGRLTKFACMIRARDVLASNVSASFWQSRATNEGNRSIRVLGPWEGQSRIFMTADKALVGCSPTWDSKCCGSEKRDIGNILSGSNLANQRGKIDDGLIWLIEAVWSFWIWKFHNRFL